MKAALLLASLLSATCLWANPDGKGQLQLDFYRGMVDLEQNGDIVGLVPEAWVSYKRDRSSGGSGSLSIPIGEALTVWVGGGMDLYHDTVHVLTKDWWSKIDVGFTHQDWDLDAGLKLYPAAWRKPAFDDAANGNPDGYLFWPVLKAASSYQRRSNAEIINEGWGIFAGTQALPDSVQDGWTYALGLTLPLHRRLSLDASYMHQQDQHFQAGDQSANEGGRFEGYSLGATFFLPITFWAPYGDPDEYFHGVGWLGEVRFHASLSHTHDLLLGEADQDSNSFSLTAPLGPLFALRAGYSVYHFTRSYFDGNAYFVNGHRDEVDSRASVGAILNFAGLPWF